MVGGACKINKDIPPYSLCGRDPISYAGVNLVGLRRRGFESDTIRTIKDIYDLIYFQGYNFSDSLSPSRSIPYATSSETPREA